MQQVYSQRQSCPARSKRRAAAFFSCVSAPSEMLGWGAQWKEGQAGDSSNIFSGSLFAKAYNHEFAYKKPQANRPNNDGRTYCQNIEFKGC